MKDAGDYIPRQAAREAVWQILNGMGYSEKHNNRLVEEIDAVFDDISAADVRPVVLCKDCKYYFKDVDGYEMCENSEGYDHVSEDGFCAWAVKMEKKLMVPWIYADLDTIIDSYSEPSKEE